MVPMIIAVNVVGALVGTGLGRASTIAIADVEDSQIVSWEEYEVRWDLSHDQPVQSPTGEARPSHGTHHGRIVSFMKEHNVQVVVTGHVGPPMAHTLDLMGIAVVTGAIGDARQAAVDAAQLVIHG